MTKYLVRQYAPTYFSGFDMDVVGPIEYDEITNAPWMERFRHHGFKEFKIEPYTKDELIVSAKYENGESWVAAFALPEDSNEMSNNGDLMRDNWRYKPHKSWCLDILNEQS